jgi:hypothetical protein
LGAGDGAADSQRSATRLFLAAQTSHPATDMASAAGDTVVNVLSQTRLTLIYGRPVKCPEQDDATWNYIFILSIYGEKRLEKVLTK